MSDSQPASANKAVFLSYASQDAEAVERIASALRNVGVEVWFDKNELVGGDAWDRKIRLQIKECALFVPVISSATQARGEGYFRLEWKLAVDRSHLMAPDQPFLLPVVIDNTPDAAARVADEFRAVQWTRLPGGETSPAFCARVKKLLSGPGATTEPTTSATAPRSAPEQHATAPKSSRPWLVPVSLTAAAVVALAMWQPWKKTAPTARGSIAPTSAPISGALQLAKKAQALFESPNITRDDMLLAEDYCKQAVKADPEDGEIWAISSELNSLFFRGSLDRAPERLEQARTQAERALKLAPRSTEAKFARASYLRGLDGPSLAEAEKILRELTVETPGDARVWISLGKVVWGAVGFTPNLARADEALTIFARAATISAARAEALGQSGWLKFNLNRYAEAESDFDEALRIEPRATIPYALKGLIATLRGDLPAAHAAYDRMSDELRRSEGWVAAVADLWLRERRADKALDVLAGVTRDYLAGPSFTGTTDGLRGYAYLMDGKTAAARSAWQAALKVVEQRRTENPRERFLLLERANLLALLDEREAAATALRLFEEVYPASASTIGLYRFQSIPVHALLEPPDRVVDLILERCAGIPTGGLRTDYRLERLQDNTRYKDLLSRVTVSAPLAAPEANPIADQKSVAVLAFADNSPGRDSEYFSDGISEELINALGKVPGLKVPARTSSFYFKGKNVPVPEIAKQLGVAYVIEGSVQRAGEKVKISARLSKASDGFQVWTDSFTRDAKDVFAVEEEISGLIAKNLSLKLSVNSAVAAVNPRATELYLQATRTRLMSDRAAAANLAEELYQQALKLEPRFVRAHAALTSLWLLRAYSKQEIGRFDQRDGAELARLTARSREGVALDQESSDAHGTLGLALALGWKSAEALEEMKRAVVLNPNDVNAHALIGAGMRAMGDMDKALEEGRRAYELDPLAVGNLTTYGHALNEAGQYAAACAIYDRALALQPMREMTLIDKATALARLGRNNDAVMIVADAQDITDSPQDITASLVAARIMILRQAGRLAEAEALRPRLGSQDPTASLALGLTEEALATLDPNAVTAMNAHFWVWDPLVDPIRSDPRFAKFLATLGLTEAHSLAQAWRKAHPPEKPAVK